MATAQPPLKQLTLSGPAAVVSYPLMVMAEQQSLKDQNIEFNFIRWNNPDQLRAMIIGQQVDFSAMPSNLAAIFYNRGHKLSLLNISVWNIMWILSNHANLDSLADLSGQEIVVPFKNDMPSIVLRQLLSAQLGDKANTVKLRYTHNLMDATQLLLAGKVKHALLIEPIASLALFRAQNNPAIQLKRGINISQQWRETFPATPKLPQAGIIANTSVNQDKQLLAQVNEQYIKATNWCNQDPVACADIVARYLPKIPKSALIDAIKMTRLNVVSALAAKADLINFYQLLATKDPKRIGGKLPEPGFYQ